MNKEWSELNKLMQTQIKKKDTYDSCIGTLFSLRDNLWDMIISFKDELSRMRYHISTLRVIIARPLRTRCGISFVSRISWLTHNQRG